MSFDAGTIMGHLKLEKGGFASEILNANAMTAAFGSTITSMVSNPIAGAIQLVKQLASAAWEALQQVANVADASAKAAQAAGTSVEFFSGLAHAAKLGGVGVEQLSAAMAKLNKGINDANSGNSAAQDSFRAVGIAYADTAGKARPMKDVMYDLADAMAAESDAGRKAYLATLLLGESGGKLVPTLGAGAASLEDMIRLAHATGQAFSTSGAQIGKEYNKAIAEAKGELGGLFQSIELDALQEFTAALTAIKVVFREIREELKPLLDMLPDLRPSSMAASILGISREDLLERVKEAGKASDEAMGDSTRSNGKLGEKVGREVSDSQVRQAKAFSAGVKRKLDKDDWERSLVL